MRKLVLIPMMLLVVAACSKQSSTPPRGAGAPVTIVATDSGFTIPDTLREGLNHLTYENHGSEIHECQFIYLPAGMSAADYIAQVKSGVAFPAGAKDCSGPGLLSPGEHVEMWSPLEAGTYMIGCWMGKHMTETKPVTFVVHGAPAQPVQPPHEDVTVRMVDFRFELDGALKRGEQVIRYETVGPSMHEADIIKLGDGRTVEDVAAWFKHNQRDPLPGTIAGGCMDSHDLKRVTWVKRSFAPGRYVFWCDMPMIQSDAPADTTAPHVSHAEAGMVKEFAID
jgi:hypothetical protein